MGRRASSFQEPLTNIRPTTVHSSKAFQHLLLRLGAPVFAQILQSNSEILMPDLSLDLRHLRYALAVAELGSFRRAALQLDLPQSTVSRRVKSLEDRIGIAIFRRDHTGIQITPAGRRFLDEAAIGARHLSNAVSAMNSVRRGEAGQLHVSMFAALSTGFVKSLFQQYRRRYKQVNVRLEESTAQISVAAILEGRLDVAFVTGEPTVPGCESLRLWDERLFLVLPEGHALLSSSHITWESLRPEPFIVTSGGRGPEIEDHLLAGLSKPGFRPDIQSHAVSRETLINMVALGFGVALVTESAIGPKYDGVTFRSIGMPAEPIPASAIWLTSNTNPALKSLLKLARLLAKRLDGGPNAVNAAAEP